jgi:pilus assembly protein CpaF
LDGASVTIRKFSKKKLTVDDLISFGSMDKKMAAFLKLAVEKRQNIVVSGGTGSGKTTLLNVLSDFIQGDQRVITIEDSAELKLNSDNIVRMEARPANVEGVGRVSIRELVVNALRMRPDRIVVGECRSAEALDMLQAMNTGHDGSLTTLHANNPRDALSRLENMVMMAGFELPVKVIREQIASAVNLIVHQSRMPGHSRKIVAISEVTRMEEDKILMQDIFTFEQMGLEKKDGEITVKGFFTPTGNIPDFVQSLLDNHEDVDMSMFVPETADNDSPNTLMPSSDSSFSTY